MCVNIQIVDDNICEDDENFLLSLTAVDDCIDIFIPGGTVTIIDDDGKCLTYLTHTSYNLFIIVLSIFL